MTPVKAALKLAKAGQPVFPCHPVPTTVQTQEGPRVFGAKAPMVRGGLKSATTDKDKIKRWWKTYPDAAIGLTTGVKHDVLDVDTKGEVDGRVHLPRLMRLGLLNGCEHVVKTPSGGWHLYFPATSGLTNKARAHLGLDVRSSGGYVLAPPSYIDDGEESVGTYDMIGPTEGSTGEPLLWDLIVKTLAPVSETTNKPIELLGYERQASVASLRGWLSERASGERNNALHWAVCRCIENGIDPYELTEAAVLIGLDEHEINLTISSALRRAGVNENELLSEAEALFGRD